MLRIFLLLVLPVIHLTVAQSLLDAISKITTLSNFTAFFGANEVFANALFGNTSNYPLTILVPNDNAFAAYQKQYGVSLTDLPPEILLPLVQYHTLVSNLSEDNFTAKDGGTSSGVTIPTLMDNPRYNNRSAGIALASRFGGPDRTKGQVVFISPAASSPNSKTKRFVLSNRQNSVTGSTIRSGLSSTVGIQPLNASQGTWTGGRFHIIDNLLTLPDLCALTIRGAGLTGLDNALNRSKLWPALDSSANVTCLGPSNEAFKNAGSPDVSLNQSELVKALHFHTLPEVAYSDFLVDGQEFTSLENLTVRVKVEGEGADRKIWFNNAKVIDANVLAHNGLMHVLDAVMVPIDQMNSTPSGSPTPTASSSAPAGSTGAANVVEVDWKGWGVLMVLGVLILADVLGMGSLGARLVVGR